jgi:hypothetical protein
MGRAARNPSSFTGPRDFIAGIAGPIQRMGAEAHPAAKRGKWPVPDADDVAVFYRIEVDVIEVPRKIVRVAQRMCSQYRRCQIPLSALAARLAEIGSPERQSTRKAALDQAPARGEVGIAIGQGPDRVQVIRQHHSGFDRKRMTCARLAECRPQ